VSKLQEKIRSSAPAKALVRLTQKIHPPGFQQLSLYDVGLFYVKGLRQGALVMRATSVAWYFFLAIFPSIIFLFTLIPYVPIANFQVLLFEQLRDPDVMSPEIFKTVESTITEIMTKPHSGLLSLGFVLSLWFSTNGFSSLIGAFNHTYHSVESRTWLQRRFVSIVLVMITTVIVIAGVTLIIYTEKLAGKEGFIHYLILIVRWIFLFGLLFLFVSFIFYLGPSKKNKWKFLTVGGTFSTFLSVIASIGFAYYATNFGSYNKLYGSLGTLIIVMVFIYFNSLILLLGFELNASIHSAKNHRGPVVDYTPVEKDKEDA
jgi:membrane protein